jgi:SSS family solute:Na+ symporter
VVFTESLQAFVLLLGSITVTVMGLVKIGGWNNLAQVAGADHLNLFLPLDYPDFPWLGMILAPPIVGIWYWCTDQVIVQRVLAAKNETQARKGSLFASYLKLFPFFIFFIPGVIAYALAKTGQLQLQAADQAFPTLVKALLPAGIRGLVVGRLATGVVVVSGILWIPFMKYISGELYHYLQSVQSYLAPPIFAVFFLGIFWKRINSKGALTALIGGFVLGMLRLIAELNKDSLGGWLHTFADVNFLYFCVYLTLVCIGMMVVVSMFTRPPSYEKIDGLTYATTAARDKQTSRASWTTGDLILCLLILAIIAAVLIYFSPLILAR